MALQLSRHQQERGSTMAEKLKCPHCGAVYEEWGLQYNCTHSLNIKRDESGEVTVALDRDLGERSYFCFNCGHELFREDVGEIDDCIWF